MSATRARSSVPEPSGAVLSSARGGQVRSDREIPGQEMLGRARG
ncbi:hypothetical protein SGL43_00605 [Streptomyces globisporus]|uniref:Uncharacterized protein n=1 Tax=Streptomyces globisporus TaxID=1908 RepID=A0ABN8UXI9_STRGL|nr:hypothetical protein SGL43_00605 [Streptomyces globisporus]